MARTVEDVLSRRTRALLLDARASMESTEVVVEIMARELQKDKSWKKQQIKIFLKLAEKYLA